MKNKYLKIQKDMELLRKLAMKYNLVIIIKNNSLSNVAQ